MEKNKKIKEKDQKNLKIVLLIGIAVIILITIIVISINNIKRLDKSTQNIVDAAQNQTSPEQKGVEKEVSLIDMENSENAKIEEGEKENISTALLEEKEINGFRIKNIKLYSKDGSTIFKAEVINNSGKEFIAKPIVIKFVNKESKEYSVLNTYIGDIKLGESGYINASTTEDVANAYNFIVNFNE